MVSTGDIRNANYNVLGVVGALVNDKNEVTAESSGCGQSGKSTSYVTVDANSMYQKGAAELLKNAGKIGGNAVIYASFEYRISVTGKAPNIERVKELFCCGTAVQLAH